MLVYQRVFLVSPSPNLGSTGYPLSGEGPYLPKIPPPLPEQIGPCQEAPETSHPFFLYFMEHAQWHAVTCSDMHSLTRFLRGGAHRLKMSWVILSVPSSGLWFHPIEIAIVWRWIIHFPDAPMFFWPERFADNEHVIRCWLPNSLLWRSPKYGSTLTSNTDQE